MPYIRFYLVCVPDSGSSVNMSSDFGELLVELADEVFDADTSGEQRMDLLLFDVAELIFLLGRSTIMPSFSLGHVRENQGHLSHSSTAQHFCQVKGDKGFKEE